MNTSNKRYHPVFLGVFLVAMAVLSLEVILTRIFSFSIWYHFAYLTISMALLGFGSSGAILAAYPQILAKGRNRVLVVVSLVSCCAIIGALLIFSRYPLQPGTMFTAPIQFSWSLLGYYVGITLPFFFAGMAIATSLEAFAEEVSYLYFWDLFGAAIGSLLSLLLINWLGAPGGVLVCALLMLVAASFFATQISKTLTFVMTLLSLGFVCVIPFVKNQITIMPCDQKAVSNVYEEPGRFKSLFSEWNAINRVDVYTSTKKSVRDCLWCNTGISEAYKGTFPDVHTILFDAHNGSNIYQFSGNMNKIRFLDYHLLKTPYVVKEKPKVLILGVGGGIDVLNALNNDASSITAVELQPLAVNLLKGKFARWTGYLFTDYEQINLIAGEGRNFVSSTDERYDHIQITSTDTFAALNTGAYLMMESYLYTVDAISTYFDHLTENGTLCIIIGDMLRKGGYQYQPLNSRLVLQFLEALRAKGIESPQRHIAVFGKRQKHGVVRSIPLLKKTPFTRADMVKLRSFSKKVGTYVIFDPLVDKAPDSFMEKVIRAGSKERESLIDEAPYNIIPCTDDNPFFFHFIRWNEVLDVFNPKKYTFITPVFGQAILLLLLAQSIILSFIFIILPLLTSTKTRFKAGKSLGYLLYFLSLGIGFMFIEISFIQKFVLFLGYPAYAFAITIFSLLLFSGLGSYWTGKFERSPESSIKNSFLALVPILLLYAWFLPYIFNYFIGENFWIKGLIAVLFQMPLGFVLGMFFPLGIKVVNRVNVRMVPWAWGINGMSSVVSTIVAIILAMNYGFAVVVYLAIAVYFVGTASMLRTRGRS
jgi:hypothetical protein